MTKTMVLKWSLCKTNQNFIWRLRVGSWRNSDSVKTHLARYLKTDPNNKLISFVVTIQLTLTCRFVYEVVFTIWKTSHSKFLPLCETSVPSTNFSSKSSTAYSFENVVFSDLIAVFDIGHANFVIQRFHGVFCDGKIFAKDAIEVFEYEY